MTEQRVRELLSDVADAVPPPQLAERAWRQSVRVRRRRVAATAVVAVGTVVAVAGIVGVLNDGAGTIPRPDGDQETRLAAGPVQAGLPRPPDAWIHGAKAWVGPTVDEEARLPRASSRLPASIDLASSAAATDKPGPALAAFAATDPENQMTEVMVVEPGGGVTRLETPGLDVVDNPNTGDPVLPLNISSLSPDGRKLVLAQNHQVVVYDLVAGGHRDLSTQGEDSYNVGWASDGQIQLPDGVIDPKTRVITAPQGATQGDSSDQGGPTDIWPPRSSGGLTAQAVSDQAVPALGSRVGDDPVLIRVWGAGRRATLALPSDTEDLGPRSRVVGWLGPDEVAFQSQDYGTYRVLGWDTNTGAVRVLTNVTLPDGWDRGVTASWADVSN